MSMIEMDLRKQRDYWYARHADALEQVKQQRERIQSLATDLARAAAIGDDVDVNPVAVAVRILNRAEMLQRQARERWRWFDRQVIKEEGFYA